MASAWTLIIKNESLDTDVIIEDLGITIAFGTQITFSNQFTYEELASSDDLRGFVDDGTLVANNGSVDLTKSEGKEYLTLSHHFYNMGQDFWTKPCNYRVIDIVDAAGMAALSGMNFKDVCVNTTDDKYYEYMEDATSIAEVTDVTCLAATALNNKYFLINKVGTSYHVWYNVDALGNDPSPGSSIPIEIQVSSSDDADTVAAETRTKMLLRGFSVTTPVAALITITNPIGGDVVDATAGDSGFTVLVTTDGVDSTFSWQELGVATELDRVINLADATESIFELNDSVWENQGDPGANGKTVGCLVSDTRDTGKETFYSYSTELNIWRPVLNFTLNDAYHAGDEDDDHTIIVNDGPVIIDASSSTYSPFNLTNLTSFPVTNLATGDIAIVNGDLYTYDSNRGKWLSGAKDLLVFGRRGDSKNQYLNYSAGNLVSNNSGLRLPQNAVIVGMTVQLDASGTCIVHIRKNDSATSIASLTVTSANGAIDNDMNADAFASDYLQCYVEATNPVEDPMVLVRIAYTS